MLRLITSEACSHSAEGVESASKPIIINAQFKSFQVHDNHNGKSLHVLVETKQGNFHQLCRVAPRFRPFSYSKKKLCNLTTPPP
jgi:hypothetical protein